MLQKMDSKHDELLIQWSKKAYLGWGQRCGTITAVFPDEDGSISNSTGPLSGLFQPNVIHPMIPECIVKQYLTYSEERDFTQMTNE